MNISKKMSYFDYLSYEKFMSKYRKINSISEICMLLFFITTIFSGLLLTEKLISHFLINEFSQIKIFYCSFWVAVVWGSIFSSYMIGSYKIFGDRMIVFKNWMNYIFYLSMFVFCIFCGFASISFVLGIFNFFAFIINNTPSVENMGYCL